MRRVSIVALLGLAILAGIARTNAATLSGKSSNNGKNPRIAFT